MIPPTGPKKQTQFKPNWKRGEMMINYVRHRLTPMRKVTRLRGLGPLTFGSVDRRSIQLSYRRKTRSDKFPLTLHKTGQYCKLYYFGTDRKTPFNRYLEQANPSTYGKLETYSCNHTERTSQSLLFPRQKIANE